MACCKSNNENHENHEKKALIFMIFMIFIVCVIHAIHVIHVIHCLCHSLLFIVVHCLIFRPVKHIYFQTEKKCCGFARNKL